MAKDSINSIDENCRKSSPLTVSEPGGVIIDLGTGDGRFVYQNARKNPNKFYIGIDASTGALEKLSEKIHRKPAKGGLKNALFVHASVESLPEDLHGIANEVHVHFPWGTLLRAVAGGDIDVLKGIRTLCAEQALLEVVIGIDEQRDRSEWQRLGIPIPTDAAVQSMLRQHYEQSGFNVSEQGQCAASQWPEICTSWAQRLRIGHTRSLFYLIAEAV